MSTINSTTHLFFSNFGGNLIWFVPRVVITLFWLRAQGKINACTEIIPFFLISSPLKLDKEPFLMSFTAVDAWR